MNFDIVILPLLFSNFISISGWTFAVIVGVKTLKRGNPAVGQLFLIASSLFLLSSIIAIVMRFIMFQPFYIALGSNTWGFVSSVVEIARTVIYIPAIILLIYSFWLKSK